MRKRITVWNGMEYPSLRAAAKALKVSYDTLQNRLRKGYTCDVGVPISNITDKEIVGQDSVVLRRANTCTSETPLHIVRLSWGNLWLWQPVDRDYGVAVPN